MCVLTLRIRNQGPPKRKTLLPPPPLLTPSEVEGVRIVVISFRNIAKNADHKMFNFVEDFYLSDIFSILTFFPDFPEHFPQFSQNIVKFVHNFFLNFTQNLHKVYTNLPQIELPRK